MIDLSNFGETLIALMFDNGNMSTKALAAELNIPAPTITRYRKGQHLPTIKNLISIADYFHCSTDYLLGLEPENPDLKFKVCPPFSEQIKFLTNYFQKNSYRFYHEVPIPESSFFEWKNGSSIPTLDNIKKIADHFHCRIDFVLGREA